MKQSDNKQGFTLVELLVSIFIIILMSGIIFANYRRGGEQFALQRSANKLAQDIRRAQAMAMSAEEFQGSVPPRYGLEFTTDNPNYYILFADGNDNGKYEPGTGVGEDGPYIENIPLEEGVWVNGLFTPASKTQLWITFKPPDPITTIRDPGEVFPSGSIQLTNTNNQTKTVSINTAGLIEIE